MFLGLMSGQAQKELQREEVIDLTISEDENDDGGDKDAGLQSAARMQAERDTKLCMLSATRIQKLFRGFLDRKKIKDIIRKKEFSESPWFIGTCECNFCSKEQNTLQTLRTSGVKRMECPWQIFCLLQIFLLMPSGVTALNVAVSHLFPDLLHHSTPQNNKFYLQLFLMNKTVQVNWKVLLTILQDSDKKQHLLQALLGVWTGLNVSLFGPNSFFDVTFCLHPARFRVWRNQLRELAKKRGPVVDLEFHGSSPENIKLMQDMEAFCGMPFIDPERLTRDVHLYMPRVSLDGQKTASDEQAKKKRFYEGNGAIAFNYASLRRDANGAMFGKLLLVATKLPKGVTHNGVRGAEEGSITVCQGGALTVNDPEDCITVGTLTVTVPETDDSNNSLFIKMTEDQRRKMGGWQIADIQGCLPGPSQHVTNPGGQFPDRMYALHLFGKTSFEAQSKTALILAVPDKGKEPASDGKAASDNDNFGGSSGGRAASGLGNAASGPGNAVSGPGNAASGPGNAGSANAKKRGRGRPPGSKNKKKQSGVTLKKRCKNK